MNTKDLKETAELDCDKVEKSKVLRDINQDSDLIACLREMNARISIRTQ